jgi:outer membrane protein assembly factor BamB
VICGSRVYVGSLDGNLYVLDLVKGTPIQTIKLGMEISASPAIYSSRLVIGAHDGTLFCLGAKK